MNSGFLLMNQNNKKTVFLRQFMFLALLLNFAFIGPLAFAQQGGLPPPEVSFVDKAGVNVLSGTPQFSQQDLQIGSGVSSLSHTFANYGDSFWGFWDDFKWSVSYDPNTNTDNVSIGHKSERFGRHGLDSTGYVNYPGRYNGAKLQQTAGGYIYTESDGTVTNLALPSSRTYPNGYSVTRYTNGYRLQSVVTNTGLQFKFVYRTNIQPPPLSSPPTPAEEQAWAYYRFPTGIIAINNAIEYCDPLADTCALTQEWPRVSYIWPDIYSLRGQSAGHRGTFTVTDPIGRVTNYHHSGIETKWADGRGTGQFSARVTAVKGEASDGPYTNTYEYGTEIDHVEAYNVVTAVIIRQRVVLKSNIGAAQWTYTYNHSPVIYRDGGTSSGPTKLFVRRENNGAPGSEVIAEVWADDTHALYILDKRTLIDRMTTHGKEFDYDYDARGNLIKITHIAKAGSAESGTSKAMEAEYPSSCINLKTCNKPTWVSDAKGNRTNYTYYEEHGGIKTVIMPADTNGVSPITWYKYTQRYAWYKTAGGALTRAPTPVWLLSEELTCTEGSAVVATDTCADPTKLLITRYDYGADGVPNNLWKRGVEVVSHNQTLRTCYQYDYYGNVIAETAGKAGLSSCQ